MDPAAQSHENGGQTQLAHQILSLHALPSNSTQSVLNFNDTDWPWKKQALFYVRCPWELPPPWTIEDIEADQVNSIFYRRQRW